MSGIFGIFHLNGAPSQAAELALMARPLERRGPERKALWVEGPLGLGHTLLATTPEAVLEKLPLRHKNTGASITADVRLDNRDELLAVLGISRKSADIGDAEIVLEAYLAWGDRCVQHLLGDFAFAIWDPRSRSLFCARDHFGMRPLYYHHGHKRFFAFASETGALLSLSKVPHRLNEARIADFLFDELEAIDTTSTFFDEIYRLPPAHSVTVTEQGIRLQRYWQLEARTPLRLPSDEAYAEAFLECFTKAVDCRLRSIGPVGSMLSGGMDSGSVVAVASRLLARSNKGPLHTFSAVSPSATNCVETLTIRAALAIPGIDPHLVDHAHMQDLMPELVNQTWTLDEPFDNHMTLVRAVYIAAHNQGVKVVLDGVSGDVVLGEGSYIARLIASGRWMTAWREAVKQNEFWKGGYPPLQQMILGSRSWVTPQWIKNSVRPALDAMRLKSSIKQAVAETGMSEAFVDRIRLRDRLAMLKAHQRSGPASYEQERVASIIHPNLVVARERYDRVAAASAIEPRDPFLDRRLVEFCISLPGSQLLSGGWPKVILRRAMAGLLPAAVRWRRGKEHLGHDFTVAAHRYASQHSRIVPSLKESLDVLGVYVTEQTLGSLRSQKCDDFDTRYKHLHLARWLLRHRVDS